MPESSRLSLSPLSPLSPSLPTPVTRFARATGELHSLSFVDLKVLALAHTLEVAAHGPTLHLRPSPAPPRLHSKAAAAASGKGALPGWGAAGGDWAALDALADAEAAAAAAAMGGEGGKAAPAPEEDGGSSSNSSSSGEEEEGGDADADASDGWEVAARSNAAARRRKRAAARWAARQAAREGEEEEDEEEEAEEAEEAAEAVMVDATALPAPLPASTAEPAPPAPPALPSRIVCVTGDCAMQNVALQLGLRLVSPDGRGVTAARRWALRCSACGATSREAGRLFCPACGHAALDKVEVLAGPGGAAVYGVRKKHTLRGTIFPIPLPKGGKGSRSRDPVLAEDAMPGFGRKPRPPGKGKKSAATGGAAVAALDGEDDAAAGAGDADAWFARSGVAPPAAAAGAVGGASAVRKLRGPAAALAGWRINPNERVHQRTNRRG